ncbi:unnamed protein product [Adineta ricciae]|uniref:Uncharacterized protein n=1 Tax=Adineta ricciae TaxID=249248 RepID=A0A815R7L2_ADIRI|nr:unnamed protein product [Adineta ricciae]
MFPSKETVSCFYCEWTGRRDKLASHSNAHHPGSKVQVGIAPNALSTFWRQKSVPLATDQIEKRTNLNNANEDSPTFDQTQATATSSLTSPVTTTSSFTSPVTTISSFASPVTTPNAPSPFSPSNEHQFQQQLFYMSEQLSNLSTKFDSLLGTKSSISTTKEANEGEEFDVMFNEIKSSDDLYKMKNFEINSQIELMTCLSCSKHKTHAPKQLQSTIKSSFGVFKFIEQDAGYNQTQKFRDLKKSIRFHLSNNLHIWCAREEQKEKEEADDLMRKNEKAGYNIGRIALFCIRTGLGGLKFVETINLIDLCGGTIGNCRHSRYIYDRVRSVMAEEMKLKITEYLVRVDPILQHSVPFGVTFDKVTLLKRSIQTTLLITFVGGVLTPIYLQSPLCKTELSGKELADNCIYAMNSFGLTKKILQQQLSGCAVDGAYIHLNIDKHLSSALEMNSEWLTVSWDCAHLLELAINDVKRQRKFVWIKNFIKLCAALMRKYSYGKQYEILLETAQYLGEDILAPKQFHATRFVSSERRVYETVLRDWRSLHEVQEKEDQLNALSHGDVSTRTRRAHTVSHQGVGDETTFKVSFKAKILIQYL